MARREGFATLLDLGDRGVIQILDLELVAKGDDGGVKPVAPRELSSAAGVDLAAGKRDFAILMLLPRLGLRRGEVAALGLDDADWRAGEILIRGKGVQA